MTCELSLILMQPHLHFSADILEHVTAGLCQLCGSRSNPQRNLCTYPHTAWVSTKPKVSAPWAQKIILALSPCTLQTSGLLMPSLALGVLGDLLLCSSYPLWASLLILSSFHLWPTSFSAKPTFLFVMTCCALSLLLGLNTHRGKRPRMWTTWYPGWVHLQQVSLQV